jgi:hypothetical protein
MQASRSCGEHMLTARADAPNILEREVLREILMMILMMDLTVRDALRDVSDCARRVLPEHLTEMAGYW